MAVIISKTFTIPTVMPQVGTALNDCTWEQISLISSAGQAADYFSIGDTKTIILDGIVGNKAVYSQLKLDVIIIGIDHNSSIEGSNRIHFQIGQVYLSSSDEIIDICLTDSLQGTITSGDSVKAFSMNTGALSSGGWKDSHMRNYILGNSSTPSSPASGSLMSALPSDLRKVLKPVTKYTDNKGDTAGSASHVSATSDYIWLLSEFEMFGSISMSNSSEKTYQKQYDYYKTTDPSKLSYNNYSMITHWLRSYASNNPGYFCDVSAWGEIDLSAANYSRGIAPAFAV